MSQETEKEDPRQVPPKQYAGTQPGQNSGGGEKTGGMQDDVDDARGATDDGIDDNITDSGSRSRKDDTQQRSAAKRGKEEKGDNSRVGGGSYSGSGGSGSSGSDSSKR